MTTRSEKTVSAGVSMFASCHYIAVFRIIRIFASAFKSQLDNRYPISQIIIQKSTGRFAGHVFIVAGIVLDDFAETSLQFAQFLLKFSIRESFAFNSGLFPAHLLMFGGQLSLTKSFFS